MSHLAKTVRLLAIAILTFTLLSTTTFAQRIIVRDYPLYQPYRLSKPPVYRNTYQPRPRYHYSEPRMNTSSFNINVDVNVTIPSTPVYQYPTYYSPRSYDYFLIDYPQDDFYIYNYYPQSFHRYWWY